MVQFIRERQSKINIIFQKVFFSCKYNTNFIISLCIKIRWGLKTLDVTTRGVWFFHTLLLKQADVPLLRRPA